MDKNAKRLLHTDHRVTEAAEEDEGEVVLTGMAGGADLTELLTLLKVENQTLQSELDKCREQRNEMAQQD